MTTMKSSYKMQQLPPLECHKAAAIRAHRMLLMSDVKKAASSPVPIKCIRSKKMLRFQDVNENDKENVFQPVCGSTPHGNRRHSASTPLIKSSDQKAFSWSLKKVTTPSQDEKLDKSVHIPCLPNFLTPKGSRLLRSSSSKAKERSRKVKRLEQYFVNPDRVNRAQGNLVNGGHRVSNRLDTPAPVRVKEMNNNIRTLDDSVVAIIGGVPVSLSPMHDKSKSLVLSNCSLDERVCSAMDISPPQSLCDSLNESTKMTLNDISQISQISSPHEQASSANLSGAFHSTFQYPLHSTFNYPLHSSFNFSNILRKEKPRVSEANKCEEKVSDCTCSSNDSKNCTEIDVDEYEKTFCKSSYLSSDHDETCHNNTPCSKRDSSDDQSHDLKILKRQEGLAELSSTTQERSDPTGADSFFDITTRLDDMAASGASDVTQPSVLTTLPSCSEYEEYSRIKLNVTQNLGVMCSSARTPSNDQSRQAEKSSRKSRSSRRRQPGDGAPSRVGYAKNCRSLSSNSRKVSSHHNTPQQVSELSRRRYKSRNHDNSRPSQSSRRPMSNDSAYSSPSSSGHYTISDNTGCERRIVPGSSTPSINLSHEQKRALAKKLKHFSGSFNRSKSGSSVGHKYEIKTLGHF